MVWVLLSCPDRFKFCSALPADTFMFSADSICQISVLLSYCTAALHLLSACHCCTEFWCWSSKGMLVCNSWLIAVHSCCYVVLPAQGCVARSAFSVSRWKIRAKGIATAWHGNLLFGLCGLDDWFRKAKDIWTCLKTGDVLLQLCEVITKGKDRMGVFFLPGNTTVKIVL